MALGVKNGKREANFVERLRMGSVGYGPSERKVRRGDVC